MFTIYIRNFMKNKNKVFIILCIDIILIISIGLIYSFFKDKNYPITFGFPNSFIVIYKKANIKNLAISFNILQFIINLIVYGPISIIIYLKKSKKE